MVYQTTQVFLFRAMIVKIYDIVTAQNMNWQKYIGLPRFEIEIQK